MAKKTKKEKKSGLLNSGLIDITKKKFRWSEYLAEKIIKGVAFLSITIIVLIFIFVFRESLPIFTSSKPSEVAQTTGEEMVQETYGEVTDQPVAEEVQETYGEVTDDSGTAEIQETYGEVTDTSAVADAGGTYAVAAIGYHMVYGGLKFVNFAHGSIAVFGAYIAWSLSVG